MAERETNDVKGAVSLFLLKFFVTVIFGPKLLLRSGEVLKNEIMKIHKRFLFIEKYLIYKEHSFFFLPVFFSRTFTIHWTAGEGGG